MKYLLLLAGGTGTRMGANIPKQFIEINDKPIIMYTLERILSFNLIDRIIIVCHHDYLEYCNDLLKKYNIKNVDVTEGGENRLESTVNGLKYVESNYGLNDDDLFLAHDSVRPFVSYDIINNNIVECMKYNGATTASPLIETIQELDENRIIKKLYPRDNLVSGQSPQTFNIKIFMDAEKRIPKDVKDKFTDLAEVYSFSNYDVKIVNGEKSNIKITTPFDLTVAKCYINENQ